MTNDPSDRTEMPWLMRIYAEMKNYPNVTTTKDDEIRGIALRGLAEKDGNCPCRKRPQPCPCNQIEAVNDDKLSICMCGLFVRKEVDNVS